MSDVPVVLISSTARDLPEHRKEVMDACLRLGLFPKMMEHLPASTADAIRVSVALVDEAEIYQGIFAHRYGYVPEGCDISFTEMEYNRAVERGIPRLIFLMHDDHPILAADVEKGSGALKLEALKARLGNEHVVGYFKSPVDLRAQVIHSLARYRRPDPTALHYVGDIPLPPEPYVAHPYTLLQTSGLVGRRMELDLLSDWVANPGCQVHRARILSIVAIGGMGKSALTWTWFNDAAPRQMQPLAGRLWWSFYESDASFENFVTRALAYVSRRPRAEVQSLTVPEREERLLAILDREPFLVVLDGFERLLVAYAGLDAARLADDELDVRTANTVAVTLAQPHGATPSSGQHRLRRTADARVGSFLRKLAGARSARILISTRLYPADLQMVTGAPVVGCSAYILRGLGDDDALSLWRAFGVGGSPEALLPLFHSCDNYPLLIRALAGEVAGYRREPGDFDRWLRDHPGFEPARLPLVQAKSHILSFALRGMDETTRAVLDTVAAFRMPASYDTLAALLVGPDRRFADEAALDVALTELEDRGLLGWDRRANRYDLHPIVRGIAWDGLDADARRGLYGDLQRHFEALPAAAEDHVACIDDLSPAVELYNALVGLGRHQDAWNLFRERLFSPMQYRLSCTRQLVELIEMLRSGDPGHVPELDSRSTAHWLRALAEARHRGGQPGLATRLYRECIERSRGFGAIVNTEYMLADALYLAGALREAEGVSRTVLDATQSDVRVGDVPARGRGWENYTEPSFGAIYQDVSNWTAALHYCRLGQVLAARGVSGPSDVALRRALEIFIAHGAGHREGGVRALLAQRALWMGQFTSAVGEADRAWELAHQKRYERDFARAARLQGGAALALGSRDRADERLGHALARARAIGFAEEELPALIALADLRRRQGDLEAARELLEDAREPAERGPYPLFHADVLNVLARVERDVGRREAAIAAARAAYRQAWCDGPPFAYHWGLEVARMHLADLGAPEPDDLPPFVETAHAPMPVVATDHRNDPRGF